MILLDDVMIMGGGGVDEWMRWMMEPDSVNISHLQMCLMRKTHFLTKIYDNSALCVFMLRHIIGEW